MVSVASVAAICIWPEPQASPSDVTSPSIAPKCNLPLDRVCEMRTGVLNLPCPPHTMSVLISIPEVTAYHLPTKASEKIALAAGTLSLTLVPADPPSTTAPVLTLSVGSVSFPLSHATPLSATDTTQQHASYIFAPGVPSAQPGVTNADIGAVGFVKIAFKTSKNQVELDEAEALCKRFEEVLKAQNVWRETDYYTDDDTQTAIGAMLTGSAIGKTLASFGQNIAARIEAFADSHMQANPNPQHPAPPSDGVKSMASTLQSSTATLSQYAHAATEKITEVIHDGAQYVGERVKDMTKDESAAAQAQPQQGGVAQTVKQGASNAWEEVKMGASGAADGCVHDVRYRHAHELILRHASLRATTVGTSLSQNTHRTIEHDLGPEADAVATGERRDLSRASVQSVCPERLSRASVHGPGARACQPQLRQLRDALPNGWGRSHGIRHVVAPDGTRGNSCWNAWRSLTCARTHCIR